MNEYDTSHEKDRRMQDKCEQLMYDALYEVGGRYGTGYEEEQNEDMAEIRNLPYHNLQHSWRVRDTALKLAELHGLNAYDRALAGMIAAAHGVVHDGGEDDEAKSADWLVEHMKTAGFNDEDFEIARLAILGTTPILDSNGLLRSQQFALTGFPSIRSGEIALCVAAADMEALFAPYGPLVAHDLLRERLGVAGYELPPSLEGVAEFQKQQLELLKTYQPLYPRLEEHLGNRRKEIYTYHKHLLDDVESGAVTSWQQMYALDQAFYDSCSWE